MSPAVGSSGGMVRDDLMWMLYVTLGSDLTEYVH